MLYEIHQAHADALWPLRLGAETFRGLMRYLPNGTHPATDAQRRVAAGLEVFAQARLTHRRPAFDIRQVESAGRVCEVVEEVAYCGPFGDLLRFRKDSGVDGDPPQPRVLIVAPMSGHFATLLRETVTTMLADHDVYITDWKNARDISILHGRFGLDEYITHLIRFLEEVGPGAHMVAVCQPCVATLAAAALMAQDNHPGQPRSMTLMAGPIDCRINPTEVNRLATSRPIHWFEHHLIATVPLRFVGGLRRVYPGFLQLGAFMSMNLDRHARAFAELFRQLVDGLKDEAAATAAFYEEYFAVADLPAEFYLETVSRVFQDYALPRGELTWKGQRIDPGAIRRTALLTVEGERDDICAVGQTMAAHELCNGIRPYLKQHHVQVGVGHYGVFSGRRWNRQIYPLIRDMIHVMEQR